LGIVWIADAAALSIEVSGSQHTPRACGRTARAASNPAKRDFRRANRGRAGTHAAEARDVGGGQPYNEGLVSNRTAARQRTGEACARRFWWEERRPLCVVHLERL